MTHPVAWQPRSFKHAALLFTALCGSIATGAATSCPLGNHEGPRARLLHGLIQPDRAALTRRVAETSHPAPPDRPARTELGRYPHDLPMDAAAPTSALRPPLYDNLGHLTWAAARPSQPEAGAYFDQGYRMAWAFNHAEAVRAFRAAQDLDPSCALCFWGEAWALGPHINFPATPDADARARVALESAKRLVSPAEPLQAALIAALTSRYVGDASANRQALDQAYAEAMTAVQARFPDSPDVAILTADALMNLAPWDYWADGGRTAKGDTARIVELIEGVLGERKVGSLVAALDHPGAIHLYIHMVEASDRPERAVPHADRLAALMPGAGHLVHMPSHIWYRVGRWRDSLDANVQAAAADEALVRRGGASLLYSEGYYAHNVHFVLASALMGGDGQTALAAADKLAGIVSDRAKREVLWTQPIAAAPYTAHARFSSPDTVLALPEPDRTFPFVRAAWHYARGVALARLGRAGEAEAEAIAIGRLAQSPEMATLATAGVPGVEVLTIAGTVIEARMAQQAGDHAASATLFARAAEIQDRLPYMEPPFWDYPIHQSLGAALIAQDRLAEAEAAFRRALKASPNNGWAAAGLLAVAQKRGDGQGIEEASRMLKRSWFGGAAPPLDRL